MLKIDYTQWSYIRCPDVPWDVLMETLVLDTEGGCCSEDLKEEISQSLEAIETLILRCEEDVVLKVGDEFDLVPAGRGVVVRKKPKRNLSTLAGSD